MRKVLVSTVLTSILFASVPAANAQSLAPSDASMAASAAVGASGVVVAGAALAAGSAVVTAVELAGESTLLVLKSVASGAVTTLQVSTRLADALSVPVGTVVTVTSGTTGVALIAQGRTVAYVPNNVGAALVHSSRVSNY
jgi:hypothetical protein